MKAVQYSGYGDPGVLQVVNTDTPKPKEGQVLVSVHAAALNPFDSKLRSGVMKQAITLTFPITVGGDFAGVVTQVPVGVTHFKVGDEVYGSALLLNGGSGAVAEQAAVNTKSIALKPANASFEQAAAMVLVGVSTVQALDQLNLGEGKKVLIHGGAGGIGSTSIQYAKHLGAYVATTVKGNDKAFVLGLGADEAIDYENQKFDELLEGFDAVFDTVGGETYRRSFSVLKGGGIVISMLEQPNQELMQKYGVTALPMNTQVNPERLNRLTTLINDGAVKPQIDSTFSLGQTAEAFQKLETGSAKGKLVIKIA